MPSRGVLAGVIVVLLFVVGLLFGLLQKQFEKKAPAPVWVEAEEVPFLDVETLIFESPTPAVSPDATSTAVAIETSTPAPVRSAAPRVSATPRVRETLFAGVSPEPTLAPPITAEPAPTEEPPATAEPTATPRMPSAGIAINRLEQSGSGNTSEIRIELTDDVPEYRVFRVRNPGRVIIDFENTAVTPGIEVSGSGTSLVKDVTARYITNAAGTAPIGRVQILLGDIGENLPSVSEAAEANALVITIRSNPL